MRIDDAIREVEPATVTPMPPLITEGDVRPKAVQWSQPSMPGGQRVAATEMKRIAVVSAFIPTGTQELAGGDMALFTAWCIGTKDKSKKKTF